MNFLMHGQFFFLVELRRNNVEIVLDDFMKKIASGYNFSIPRDIVQFVVRGKSCQNACTIGTNNASHLPRLVHPTLYYSRTQVPTITYCHTITVGGTAVQYI